MSLALNPKDTIEPLFVAFSAVGIPAILAIIFWSAKVFDRERWN